MLLYTKQSHAAAAQNPDIGHETTVSIFDGDRVTLLAHTRWTGNKTGELDGALCTRAGNESPGHGVS